MKLVKPNRNQVLCLLLILAVVTNTFFHCNSPAYRYYQSEFTNVRSDFEKFKTQIRDEFIPAIVLLATNNYSSVHSSIIPNSTSPFVVSENSIGILNARFFVCGHQKCFSFNNMNFKVGDDFFGYPIIGISPTMVTTSQGSFYLTEPPFYKKEKGLDNDKRSIL